MRLGVISDTHDRLPTFRHAVDLFRTLRVDAILHAGDYIAPFAARLIAPQAIDIPVHCVLGNNDGERKGLVATLPQLVEGPLRLTLGGRVIVMHHFIDWLTPEDRRGADILITGHTHAVVNETREGTLLLNPGECCGWLTGRCTVALLDTQGPTAEIIELPG
jgi:putative phosphoesterase